MGFVVTLQNVFPLIKPPLPSAPHDAALVVLHVLSLINLLTEHLYSFTAVCKLNVYFFLSAGLKTPKTL